MHYVGFCAAPAAVLERARAQRVLARGRPRAPPADLRRGLPARRPRRRPPAGDAGPLPPDRARARPRARAHAARRGRLPGGRGCPSSSSSSPPGCATQTPLVEQWAGDRRPGRGRPQQDVHLGCDRRRATDLWLTGWTADFPDPDGFFRGLFVRDEGPFHVDDEIEELLLRARSLQDQGERMRLYHELDRLWVAERAAILPLSYGRVMLLTRPWVRGLPRTRSFARASTRS